jgi:hypothetical protein
MAHSMSTGQLIDTVAARTLFLAPNVSPSHEEM